LANAPKAMLRAAEINIVFFIISVPMGCVGKKGWE
jgi:hypothetical protein